MSTAEDALELLEESAEDAAQTVIDIADGTIDGRHSQTRLSAAVKVLELAGVSKLEADKRHQELLRALKSQLPPEEYGNVLRALARHSAVDRERTSAH